MPARSLSSDVCRDGKADRDVIRFFTAVLRVAFAAIVAAIARIESSPLHAEQNSSQNPVEFVDVAGSLGLTFVHFNGASGRKYFPETSGPGTAFLDADGDGDLDVYLVNGAALPGKEPAVAPINALFRNDGSSFVDVSRKSGAGDGGYGMGCVGGDYDNDGDTDLYVTNFGANVLLRNVGDGVYTPTGEAVGRGRWSTGAAFFDYDRDGDLDLFVVNYVDYDLDRYDEDLTPYLIASEVHLGAEVKAYPHPRHFPGSPDRLYRNDDGVFTDVSRKVGLVDTVASQGRGLGVVTSDFDGNGSVDVYVANDAVRNYLYFNCGSGSFEEAGALAGVAYGQDGQMEAGMGVDAADYDGDGDPDLIVTNFEEEPARLYRNETGRFFADISYASGVGLLSLKPLSFGVGFIDYDNDGLLDLFIASGHVLDNVGLFSPSSSYEQPNLLLRNLGADHSGRYLFGDTSAEVGSGVSIALASRGCAFGDYDDDGDLDIIVANCGQRASLLRNDVGNRSNWLTIKTIGRASNRDGIGARVEVTAGNRVLVREVKSGGSYLSHSDMRLSFGLGANRVADSVVVTWPSGTVDRFGPVEANRLATVVEGDGT